MPVKLENVQGNILKAFNKPNMLLIFFEFNNIDGARQWLSKIAQRIPTTQALVNSPKEGKNAPELLHVSLSANGIKKLGLTLPPSRESSHHEHEEHVEDGDPFSEGMKARASVLGDTGDSSPQQWKSPFDSNVIDGVLIIASDDEEQLTIIVNQIKDNAQKFEINFVGEQKGKGMKDDNKKEIEHFGFRDGVSQPLIKGVDDKKIKTSKQIPLESKDFVLSNLEGDLSWANDGSFLVYRRLRQDVDGFWEFMNTKAAELGMTPEKLAAKFIGRWKSGAPLANHPESDPNTPEAADDNNFIYMNNDDSRGERTPRFSHIRKMYPRGDGESDDAEKNRITNNMHRILRRGIPYGTKGDNDKGLLFMCYQKDIAMQFEFVQKMWANNSKFPRSDGDTNHGHDPIIGQHHDTGFVNLLKDDGNFEKVTGFNQWVSTTAGEYFFSPSISALKNLESTRHVDNDHGQHHHKLNTVAVHLALLKNEKALLFSGAHEKLWDWTKGESNLWDPRHPDHSEEPQLNRNLFCSGHCFLPDGRLLVIGGQSTFNYPHVIFFTAIGILPLILKLIRKEAADHDIHIYNPDEPNLKLQWKRHLPGMSKARWYPTCATLPDGKALIVSGTWSHGHHAMFGGFMNTDYEIFDPETEELSQSIDFGFDKIKMYPFLQVLPNNTLFVHSEKTTKLWDITQKQFLPIEFETKTGGTRTYPGMGNCVMLPLQHDAKEAKLLLIGGSTVMNPGNNDDATTIPEMLTINFAEPSNSSGWQEKPPHQKRFLCDSVVLPDGKILVTNGSEKGTADHNKIAVMKIEIYDPETETWELLDRCLDRPRLYHSTAILLPDASVLVAGSTGHDFTRAIFNPEQHFEQEIEIIEPTYLRGATRPTIINNPSEVSYDVTFQINVDSQNITKVSLIRMSSTTHNNNMDQRCLFLNIIENFGGTITLESPKNGSWAPPGYYLLFAVNDEGIPSVGKSIRVG